MINKEVWKDIKGYEGLYQISNLGRVKSLKKKGNYKERILKYHIINKGYCRLHLFKQNKSKGFLVHSLVLNTFKPNLDKNKTQIDHINGIKTDNRVENLEWVTPKENVKRAYEKLLRKDCKKTVQIDKINNNIINVFNSSREASRKTGICQSGISKSCKNKNVTAGGYLWRYLDEDNSRQ